MFYKCFLACCSVFSTCFLDFLGGTGGSLWAPSFRGMKPTALQTLVAFFVSTGYQSSVELADLSKLMTSINKNKKESEQEKTPISKECHRKIF